MECFQKNVFRDKLLMSVSNVKLLDLKAAPTGKKQQQHNLVSQRPMHLSIYLISQHFFWARRD